MIELREWLGEKRTAHSLRVAATAVLLAKAHGEREDLAYEAGLYHDIAKELTQESLLKRGVQQNNLCKSLHEHYFPVWHAFVAPQLLQEKYQLKNKKILSAIRWHTTGRAKMSPLEKIIFLADYLEPGRGNGPSEQLLKLAIKDLDKAMAKVIRLTIDRVKAKGAKVHPYSLACARYYSS